MRKEFKNPVPVINDDTGEPVGEAIPFEIVGGHMNGNYYSYIVFGGKEVACSFDEDQPDKITIFPSRPIWYA